MTIGNVSKLYESNKPVHRNVRGSTGTKNSSVREFSIDVENQNSSSRAFAGASRMAASDIPSHDNRPIKISELIARVYKNGDGDRAEISKKALALLQESMG